jgi:ABC-type sulfate transport system permease subunit
MDNYLLISLISIALSLFLLISAWNIFEKAGQPGWTAIIPIYNLLIFLHIIGKPWWWIFLIIITPLNLVFGVWAVNLLSKSFEKGVWYTVGLIFLPYIFIPVLGFGDAQYKGAAGKTI